MSKLIESSEFGHWLLGEISQTSAQSKCVPPDREANPRQRLETLKTAKKMLLEYLILQQKMLTSASAARQYRS